MFLSLQEVAVRLGISWKTVLRLIEQGELPAIKVGRQYRISEEDLEEFIRRRRLGGLGGLK